MSTDTIVIGLIILMFMVFIVSLMSVAWWSQQTPNSAAQPVKTQTADADRFRRLASLNR